MNLTGPVEPEQFKKILEGYVPDGTGHRLGRRQKDGTVLHRPGRDITLSAPKSVSLAALIGGDRRIVSAHDKAVQRTLGWVEKNVVETRLRDPEKGRMVRAGGQKMVAATFRHDTSRNLDPQLHTHAVIANMLKGADNKWRTMANEKLYASKMLIGALYRSELAMGLKKLGYGTEKTHADGRFEIAGVSREVIEAFSTRRAEIQAAMNERGLGDPGANPRLAERAALMTRSHKREMDREALRDSWQRQAADLGFDAHALKAEAAQREPAKENSQALGTASDEKREPEKLLPSGPSRGRWTTSPSAKRCSRATISSPLRWRRSRAQSPLKTFCGPWTSSRKPGRCTRPISRSPASHSPPTPPSPTKRKPSR